MYALAIVKGFDYNAMEPDKRQALYKSVMKTLKRTCVSGWLVESYREQGVIHWKMT